MYYWKTYLINVTNLSKTYIVSCQMAVKAINFVGSVSCDLKYCKCMKAEQPEKMHLEESARSETQLRSQGPLLALPRLHVAHETNMAMIDRLGQSDYFR